jgi:glycerol-3-phosphate dehydrogenase
MQGRATDLDVAIIGAGIAGLWLLRRLHGAGYRVALFEQQAIGHGQTRYAQGIIHGGTKYALGGKLTGSSEAIAAMPARWRTCLEGSGEIDLRQVTLLSRHQYLWSTGQLTSRLAGFFASHLMRSRTTPLNAAARPAAFQDDRFHGQIYRLDEPVIDVASLITTLAKGMAIYHHPTLTLNPASATEIALGNGQRITCRQLILTAGSGNAALLAQLGRTTPAMQRRPLRMVMVRAPHLPPLWAHCLGPSATPRLTITSHHDHHATPVWYIGGQPAEEGVALGGSEQIARLQQELSELLPWIDLSRGEWSTLAIDRAEVAMADGSRPADCYLHADNGVMTAWPTKLALAPRLADQVIAALHAAAITPHSSPQSPIDLPPAPIATLPWQQEPLWS